MTAALAEDYSVQVKLPPKMVGLFSGQARYRGAKGGRGSGKTRGFALMTAVVGYQLGMNGARGQILCCREFQNSLNDSSLYEIKEAIHDTDQFGNPLYPWLQDYWECGENYVRSRDGAIQYTFLGLRRNLNSIKSTARILLCWVEEAETVPDRSWKVLIPTVREEGSEIWLSWNPETRGSATDARFVQSPSDDMKIITMNYRDNPWFPQVLEDERQNDLLLRPDTYDHIWEGDYFEYADGAYYLDQMKLAAREDRITTVAHDPALAVFTAWDLGMDDSTAIWFMQQVSNEVRLIDYYEANGHALRHYVDVLDDRGKPGEHDKPGYRYGGHVLPHDVKVRELGTGKSRLEVLQSLGLDNVTVCPQLDVEDGIEAVRNLLARCYFDADKCREGIMALRQYRREFNDERQVFMARPVHDWASHGADAFRYLAVASPKERNWGQPLRRNIRGMA